MSIDIYFLSAVSKVTLENITQWSQVAVITGIITLLLWRLRRLSAYSAFTLPLLVFYLAFVSTITIIDRVPSKIARYKLELFWSYKAIANGTVKLIAENFWNVVLFMPVGFLMAGLFRRHRAAWPAMLISAALSALLELTQLKTHRGLFELDDIFHNTLGALIGICLCLLLSSIVKIVNRQKTCASEDDIKQMSTN